MARKVVNRKQLREEADAAEAAEVADEKAGKTNKNAKVKVKRKSRAKKAAVDVRMRLFWGVFTQSMKRVALYEHNQKKQAIKKADELTAKGKSPHFVMKVKEAVEV